MKNTDLITNLRKVWTSPKPIDIKTFILTIRAITQAADLHIKKDRQLLEDLRKFLEEIRQFESILDEQEYNQAQAEIQSLNEKSERLKTLAAEYEKKLKITPQLKD